MVHARQSYGGFNPEIEDIVKEDETDKIGHEDMEADISDQQMVDYIKNKKAGYQNGDSSDESPPPPEKRKRFQKPDTSDVIKREV